MKTYYILPLIALLAMSLVACEERQPEPRPDPIEDQSAEQSANESAEYNDQLGVSAADPDIVAKLDQSLLATLDSISVRQESNRAQSSASELSELSAEDREALRAIAADDLMQAAEKKAARQAQVEQANRAPTPLDAPKQSQD